MTGRLRIAMTADPELPVPPEFYGGIERVIDLLVRGLAERGHEVTLFAHPASRAPCELRAYPRASSRGWSATLRNMAFVSSGVARGAFDLVHCFGRIAYILPLLPTRQPKLMTYQRPVTPASVRWGHRLSLGRLQFSAISRQMMAPVAHLGRWHLVYNGVPLARFDFVPEVPSDAPLVFLGRVEHIKGTHVAIEAARAAGRQLVIAGNIPAGHERYFEEQILPHVDGSRVRYVGPVDDAQKNRLLGAAAALLMPILWDEPFGIVMAEALACGTPVLGFARGALPEVVEDGVSGRACAELGGLVAAVRDLGTIRREDCRERAERLFSDTAVVEGYLAVYRTLLSEVR